MTNVISFGDARLERSKISDCVHLHLEYDRESRLVKCCDCGHFIDGFDAFEVLVAQYQNFRRQCKQAQRRIDEQNKLINTRINTLAAKQLDKAWFKRKMAVCCPHCGGGLIAEDFLNGAVSSISYELELQRRKKAGKGNGDDHGN